MVPIQERNRRIHKMRRQGIPRREVALQSKLSRARIAQLEKRDADDKALCLLSYHLPLVVETPNGNLVAGIKWILEARAAGLVLRLCHSGGTFDRVAGQRLPKARFQQTIRNFNKRSGAG